jgi:hypothetical protein
VAGLRVPYSGGIVTTRGDNTGAVRLKAALVRELSWLSGAPIGTLVFASHNRAVPSQLAVTTRVPSGLKEALITSN